MEITTLRRGNADFPERLEHIPGPPQDLYCIGAPLNDLLRRPCVAIVGSRNVSNYGKQITYDLAKELAEQGIVIISGLAFGVDAIAHQAALDAGGLTIAVLPTPVNQVYPVTNLELAESILTHDGTIVSEYNIGEYAYKQNFVARNRIVSGLADVLVITEAAEKSGTLRTATFARDQGRTVMVVPGQLTSPTSVGTNNLLKAGGTLVVTDTRDILNELGIKPHRTKSKRVKGRNQNEQTILNLMLEGLQDGEDLLQKSQLTASAFNQALTMLEIGSKIRALGANQWAIW